MRQETNTSARSNDGQRPPLTSPHPLLYEKIIRDALKEDMGAAGDITSEAVIPESARAVAHIVARSAGCIAGLEVAASVFRMLDPKTEIEICARDGEEVEQNTLLAIVRGTARTILHAERTALNLLGHLSGIATTTRDIVNRIEGTGARVISTRKTTPGLRLLEKYAVRAGGGYNHRFGLADAVLIKENHLALSGSITEAVRRVRQVVGHMVKIEVEVENLNQLEETLNLRIDAVLLDNMSPEQVRDAVRLVDGRMITEVSGGITPRTAASLAATGADLLSVGWLTHSSPTLDVAMEVLKTETL